VRRLARLADCMADGKRPSLVVEERPERGTRATKRLRNAGYVPGVVYGGKDDCISFKVNSRVLRAALHDGSALIDLKIGESSARPVIIKAEQRHPVRGQIVHIDLLEVRLDEKIHSTFAVELEGTEEAPGVKEGGVLEQANRELNIEALPTDIPERILVDVSGMEIAAVMHLSEISAPPGVTFLDDPDETIIATITVPSQVVEPEIEAETELVGEEGAEGEEGEAAEAGAEGATGDEAEAAADGGDES
jgi:large subunit ribosomal protein L25